MGMGRREWGEKRSAGAIDVVGVWRTSRPLQFSVRVAPLTSTTEQTNRHRRGRVVHFFLFVVGKENPSGISTI